MYLARCDHLSELAINIVRAAAVAGRDVEETALLAMVDMEPDRRAMNALEEAVTSGCLVTSGSRYGFRHEAAGSDPRDACPCSASSPARSFRSLADSAGVGRQRPVGPPSPRGRSETDDATVVFSATVT